MFRMANIKYKVAQAHNYLLFKEWAIGINVKGGPTQRSQG